MTDKRRPGSMGDSDRVHIGAERRKTAVRGVPVEVDRESTPPPQEMPQIARSRTPTPDELKNTLDAFEAQLRIHNAALHEVWDARHMATRIATVEEDLKANTRSTIRMEAVLGDLVVPQIKETMAKLDLCVHHLAASEGIAASVATLADKVDNLNTSLSGIKTEQAEAAVRFEEHDQRDQETAVTVRSIDTRVDSLEQHKAGDQRELALTKTQAVKREGLRGLVAAIVGAIAGLVAK